MTLKILNVEREVVVGSSPPQNASPSPLGVEIISLLLQSPDSGHGDHSYASDSEISFQIGERSSSDSSGDHRRNGRDVNSRKVRFNAEDDDGDEAARLAMESLRCLENKAMVKSSTFPLPSDQRSIVSKDHETKFSRGCGNSTDASGSQDDVGNRMRVESDSDYDSFLSPLLFAASRNNGRAQVSVRHVLAMGIYSWGSETHSVKS